MLPGSWNGWPRDVVKIESVGALPALDLFMLRPVLAGLSAATALFAPLVEHDLRVYPNTGETYRYKMSGTITIQATEAKIGMNITETVRAKDAAGWTVEVSQTGGLVQYGAQQINLPEVRQNISYHPDGLIRDLKMPEGTNSDAYRLIQMATIFRPEEKIPEGVDYFRDFPADATRGVPAARATYRIVGTETMSDMPVLKIEFRYSETTGDVPARNHGTYWIHKDKGVIVKAVQTWTDAPVSGAGKVTGQFTTDIVVQ